MRWRRLKRERRVEEESAPNREAPMCNNCQSGYLDETLRLAGMGRGQVFPNPMVGSVVLKEDRVVGRGYHRRYGSLHAEAEALKEAGDRARDGVLYCNLEPCSYTAPEKHQPPCTDRIIEAGVAQVVIGQLDPNPRVRGRGVRKLQEAGIEVLLEERPEEFLRFNDAFNTYMSLRRPFVHLKLAMSLDGRIATFRGDSKWISDEAARREVHALRAEREAVAVGVGTVIADDPSLTVRLVEGSSPKAVIFDSHLRTPPGSTLLRERPDQTVILAATPPAEDPGFNLRREKLESTGATVLLGDSDGGRVDLASALQNLREAGVRSLLVEGGSELATSFLREELFDRLTAYLAPIVIGSGVNGVGNLEVDAVCRALRFEGVRWRSLGDQQVFDAYRLGWIDEVTAPLEEYTNVYRAS
ncbi:MAG: bifunctional diaminohydroxyphosphoribosylaminopyrimidine deaminase/5-amino-6-(5-phosphoribosylamino)uracil reductase RibD [Alkalispirochaetaceae bacterium]